MIKFMCIKDFEMQDGNIAFKKGRFYAFEQTSLDTFVGKDEQDDPHWMDLYDDMWTTFVPENGNGS